MIEQIIKKFGKNNPLFIDDINLILKNLPSETLELYSDEENYIVCRGHKKFPTWIWTKDNFDKSKNTFGKFIKVFSFWDIISLVLEKNHL